MARSPRRLRRGLSGITLLIVAAVGIGLYIAFRHVQPLLTGSGCEARSGRQVITLSPGQAGIAATIAGVADLKELPPRAVTVAYAAALQESKLTNLSYGDRDSVGVFQQRPSEGWGPRQKLIDPVYATTKFFDALTKVHNYVNLPVYKAAQAVQHSADGLAYDQYEPLAKGLTTVFTGQHPHAVWCWYSGKIPARPQQQAIGAQLTRTFGPTTVLAAADPAVYVRVPNPLAGWAMAAWLVSHAQQYHVSGISYGGYQWSAASGSKGWIRDRSPVPAGQLKLG
ncbi:MAG TPA: hypothetical protein VH637_07720 [Streptosporangiaceae bacterium]